MHGVMGERREGRGSGSTPCLCAVWVAMGINYATQGEPTTTDSVVSIPLPLYSFSPVGCIITLTVFAGTIIIPALFLGGGRPAEGQVHPGHAGRLPLAHYSSLHTPMRLRRRRPLGGFSAWHQRPFPQKSST